LGFIGLRFVEKQTMPPVVSIVGKSQSGKTTFIEKLVPILKSRGHRVGVIKHAFHPFEMDTEGKDSWRHKAAGADTVMVASRDRIAMVKDWNDYDLDDLLFFFQDMDLVITEGFKRGSKPKIEIVRSARNHEPLCKGAPELLAIVSDIPLEAGVPRFELEAAEAVAGFLEERFL
jgi:molybdopterin-guanine dinucleotide biosynthesis protein B